MFQPLQVIKGNNDLFWVGSLDKDIRVFDIIMRTDYGTTYNSYVLKGSEKTAVFEISKERFFDEFHERLTRVVSPEKIDYIVADHTEPDHTGGLAKLLALAPGATVVGTATALKFLKEILNRDFKSLAVKDGDTLDLGGKTLRFIAAPNMHWPDTMFTYVPELKTLFTCDAFGCHYCDEKVFNDEISGDFIDAYKYYFDNIMGPFKTFAAAGLKKIEGLDVEVICTGHGPVIRKDAQKYLNMYREWSVPVKPERAVVVIPYVSAYGYTKKLAGRIAEGARTANVNVKLFDMVESDKGAVLSEISAAQGVLFGSPTIVGEALPPILELLANLNPTIHKGKLAGAFGSYGWSGEAVPHIMERLAQLKLATPLEGFRVQFNPSEEQLAAAFEFGKKFGEAAANICNM